ncbi:hypothetical protein BDV27DRAFT_164284 [Aspergillus caelatus]|uniref:AMP-dependent synthetase/ligase domain-containing protein n=2 Tax=Aspergillus subgen. Circumdati TaxID=2720871 RepID=A0A5N6ZLM4_9EURO|nr:uncharacterized protein BDV27DRAFT_164284 [Aspergillus caelatus]KAE8357699.1 hypothetical protein BDV27DRAFT_164284 [Aspergillus caelatus]KAE8418843.1 hypothetical protein BDV36DRAFT_294698 [Aspergillus pseudocaelatus]
MQKVSCIHEAILGNRARNPDLLAVSAWDGDLTYLDLDRLSSLLAKYLCASGLPPKTIVPLCFEKSKWAIVAVLGVLRAGAAYVFVDPCFPHARMRVICEDIGAWTMLCSAKNIPQAIELVDQPIVVQTVVKETTKDLSAELPSVKILDPVYNSK